MYIIGDFHSPGNNNKEQWWGTLTSIFLLQHESIVEHGDTGRRRGSFTNDEVEKDRFFIEAAGDFVH